MSPAPERTKIQLTKGNKGNEDLAGITLLTSPPGREAYGLEALASVETLVSVCSGGCLAAIRKGCA